MLENITFLLYTHYMKDILKDFRAQEGDSKWENCISRQMPLYERNNDIRSEFERDYTRIIHSQGYRRLKHKTQVFFSPENDHICTRIEHVTLVESIAYTIAKYLGLNVELTRAIAISHDIGHSPFGHQGEKIISKISEKDLGKKFWHEKNGLEFVDKIELLENPEGKLQPLNLTYAVRDGIISHCGEVDENGLKPRDEFINLEEYNYPNQYAPYTWEACIVKIADKISYLGRDIVDAVTLGILDECLAELYKLLDINNDKKINNTVIINDLIYDLCENSSKERGLCFSNKMFNMMNNLKKFNYENIYLSEKVVNSCQYFELVLNKIYDTLKIAYTNKEKALENCPYLIKDFENWIENYKYPISEEEYLQSVIYYISGMTDNYAISMYNKIIRF